MGWDARLFFNPSHHTALGLLTLEKAELVQCVSSKKETEEWWAHGESSGLVRPLEDFWLFSKAEGQGANVSLYAGKYHLLPKP